MIRREERISWKKLLYDFTQDTTFHGVRYITASTPFLARRFIWFCLCFLASAVFIWFLTLRLQYLNSNPKAVDVEVIYTDSVNFPAVTICNQNLFRTSAALRLGLHDLVEDSFEELKNQENGHSEGNEDTASKGFELKLDSTLEGIGRPEAVYAGITARVCRHLCVTLESQGCCSVLYERGSRTCRITPLEEASMGVKLVYKQDTNYYRRKKCQMQRWAMCSFTDGDLCDFVLDESLGVQWMPVNKNSKKVDVLRPKYDYTTMTGSGHYLLAFAKYPRSGVKAHLISPFIISETDTCLSLRYQVHSGQLSIKARLQGSDEVTVWSRVEGETLEWQRVYQKLDRGYFRLVIEAMAHEGAANMSVAIDDISIEACDQEHLCKQTIKGRGFAGTLSTGLSGRACSKWERIPSYLSNFLWKAYDPEVSERILPQINNYCRNPDDDASGPWCYTDVNSESMERCDVPSCECRAVEFTCDNGKCISPDLTCDGKDDCEDNSDEISPCNHTVGVSCEFEDGWMCGYHTTNDVWIIKPAAYGSAIGINPASQLRDGDVAVMTSPVTDLPTPACLHLSYKMVGDVHLDIFLSTNNVGYNKTLLCSLNSNDTASEGTSWNNTDLLLPPGIWTLRFEVIMASKTSVVAIDNITLLTQNCSEITSFTSTESPLTTLSMTNSTDNLTFWEATTSDLSSVTGNMSTAGWLGTTVTPPEVHEAWEHTTCQSVNNECRTCPIRFSRGKDCRPRLVQIANESLGLGSSCYPLMNRKGHNLSTCTSELFALGGNIMDIRRSHCRIKRCLSDDTQLEDLVPRKDGWAVYRIEGPEEGEGPECSFRDECACGWSYVSSNVNDVWLRTPRDRVINSTEPEDHYITLLHKEQPNEGDWSQAMSPLRYYSNISCLKFAYFTRFIAIDVMLYDPLTDSTVLIIKIKQDTQQPLWHTARATVPPGEWSLIFRFVATGQWNTLTAGIDDVMVTSGTCPDKLSRRISPMNCTFADEDYCGYHDASEGPAKWVRSKSTRKDPSPGEYYMRLSTHLDSKGSAILRSPWYTYSNLTCLQFYYFLHSNSTGRLSTLSLSVEEEDGNQTVIWRIRAITDNNWHIAQTEVYPGLFRLLFTLTGDFVRAGIDDVDLNDGYCPLKNCSTEEYQCGRDWTCIPTMYMCDGMPNCAMGEDEMDSSCRGNTTLEVTEEDETEPQPTAENTGVASNLTQIYMEAGHQGEDILYRCKWKGAPCAHSDFSKQVTDYGLCYTFNAGDVPLTTAMTGSRFGLSVTLNIEQYEYMRGPQSDAGIKVFLHSHTELPQVRDLGFAISPGTHALVGIRLNEAENLPAPWGDCATRSLDYFDDYVHSRCVRECEAKHIVDECECRDSYMPGYTPDNPPVCNLTMYFKCALPTINSVEAGNHECVCPKPCRQTVYEPALSQASLSILSVDSVLSENLDDLKNKYFVALESTQRTDHNMFVEDIRQLTEIGSHYRSLRQFVQKYLVDLEKSEFRKIWNASHTLVSSIFEKDINVFMSDLHLYREAYDLHMSDTERLLVDYVRQLDMGLRELKQLIDMSIEGRESNYLQELLHQMTIRITLAQLNFELYIKGIHDRQKMSDETGEGDGNGRHLNIYLPINLFMKQPACTDIMQQVPQNLENIRLLLEAIHNRTTGNPGNNTNLITDINMEFPKFLSSTSTIHRCLQEYGNHLTDTEKWLAEVRTMAKSFKDQNFYKKIKVDVREETEKLQQDSIEIRQLKERYSLARTSKLNFLEYFEALDQSNLLNVASFVNGIQDGVINPLQERVLDIKEAVMTSYLACFHQASQLEHYVGAAAKQSFYSNFARMIIWRNPVPDMDTPTQFTYEVSTEYWRVWDNQQSVHQFTETLNPLIDHALKGFCDVLIERLDSIEQKLQIDQKRLESALEVLQQKYQEYIKVRNIDHPFVLSNFLNMDVYFAQLKHQNVKQIEAYQTTQFLGDVGGFMGLLLGGSVLTVFELIDLFIFNFAKKFRNPDPIDEKENNIQHMPLTQNDKEVRDVYTRQMAPLAAGEMDDFLTKKI